ncbi:MAG: ATP-binding cassette domain-containing protein [Bacillota bacterium]
MNNDTNDEKETLLSLADVSFMYGPDGRYALSNITLDIKRGEYLAILGPCGAGKTTLCLTLNGIIPNMLMGELTGKVVVRGRDTSQYPVREMARTVGMVFDNPEYQLSQLTVMEEVALGLENLGVPVHEMKKRIYEVLRIVGLDGLEERSPMTLSGGQQQRLAIAAAMAMYPEVLVLDEPTTNLDPIGKEEVFAVLHRLNHERGMTIVIADHEVEAIAEYASRVLVLNEGRIIAVGSPAEVFGQVDLLASIGLRVPQVCQLVHQMEARGVKWGQPYPLTCDQAEDQIRRKVAQHSGGTRAR